MAEVPDSRSARPAWWPRNQDAVNCRPQSIIPLVFCARTASCTHHSSVPSLVALCAPAPGGALLHEPYGSFHGAGAVQPRGAVQMLGSIKHLLTPGFTNNSTPDVPWYTLQRLQVLSLDSREGQCPAQVRHSRLSVNLPTVCRTCRCQFRQSRRDQLRSSGPRRTTARIMALLAKRSAARIPAQ